ncbi:MAG: glycosyltransferase family 2 protein [Alphaproteobacteria bacterium]|nr:glycosyltransferase family 2 protein [Alphaproteobacteria bacterium]
MTVPFISIGITCFNCEDTIGRAIESAQAQVYPSFEILVVDDCSTDRSVSIVEAIAAKDERVRLIRHIENKGYPAALNTISGEARGDFIAFFDDDDTSVPERLGKQMERISSFRSRYSGDVPVLCYANRTVVQDRGTHTAFAIGRCAPEPSGADVIRFILLDVMPEPFVWGVFGSCSLMMETRFLQRIGGFDESFRRCAEWDMAIRAASAGAHFLAVDETLVTQYKTDTSDKSGTIPLVYTLRLRDKHRSFFGRANLYYASVLQAYARFYFFRERMALSRLFRLMACLCAPGILLVPQLRRKMGKIFGQAL